MVDVTKSVYSLKDTSKHFQFQKSCNQSKLRQTIYKNKEQLRTALIYTFDENSHPQRKITLLSQEAEGWKIRMSGLKVVQNKF